jgi:hypothetical protein
MLDRQHGLVIFECDACDEVLETECDDFNEALAVLRRERWKVEKVGADWVHTCPGCKPQPTGRNHWSDIDGD